MICCFSANTSLSNYLSQHINLENSFCFHFKEFIVMNICTVININSISTHHINHNVLSFLFGSLILLLKQLLSFVLPSPIFCGWKRNVTFSVEIMWNYMLGKKIWFTFTLNGDDSLLDVQTNIELVNIFCFRPPLTGLKCFWCCFISGTISDAYFSSRLVMFPSLVQRYHC